MQRKLPWMLFAASMALNILFVSGFLVGQASSGQARSGQAPSGQARSGQARCGRRFGL